MPSKDELLPRVKLIPLKSTWTCPTCSHQNVYREGIVSSAQNYCRRCGVQVQIGATRADSDSSEYVRGLYEAVKEFLAARHKWETDPAVTSLTPGIALDKLRSVFALIPVSTAPEYVPCPQCGKPCLGAGGLCYDCGRKQFEKGIEPASPATVPANEMYEDELPADMPAEDYDKWYAASRVDGVRIGPKYPAPTTQGDTVRGKPQLRRQNEKWQR